MNRKMILALTAAIALIAWASAKPGTWGKENPVNENETKAPAAKFNQWLNEFSKAYEQRDGEKMDELLKQFEGAKSEFPAAPRFEKWMAGVQEAYKDQNIEKMGRLLDNAHQFRERMRERFRQNQNRRWRENAEEFRPDLRPMRGFDGRSQERMGPGPRNFDQRPFDAKADFSRPREFQHRGQMHRDRMAERQGPRQYFDAQRPTQMQQGPRRFAPDRQRAYGPMPQHRQRYGREHYPMPNEDFDRPDFGPEWQERRFDHRMRPEFDRPYYDEQDLRRPQFGQPDADVLRDFWD